MLKLEELKSILKASLPLKRYKHSIDVYETALDQVLFYPFTNL